eukprot:TRINITY_DN3381_c0_g1_i2.p1 TRINITY_DN3381_c0_g1~~TRINITY_DN3381_c0_g1_i2.p1  ORF type:complete len:224 (+),score=62.99 TRINITY_DN3381_c0_g1_i2:399-1070(+)
MSVSKTVFSTFSCIQIGTKSWMTDDLDVECGSETHITLLVPSIIFATLLVIVLPVVVVMMLHRKQGQTRAFLFLIRGFRTEVSWWEIVVQGRKMLVLLLTLFFVGNPEMQSFTVVIAILITLVIQVKMDPYVLDSINKLESMSVITLLVMGLLVMVEDQFFQAAAVLVILNVVFLIGVVAVFWIERKKKKNMDVDEVDDDDVVPMDDMRGSLLGVAEYRRMDP